MFNADRPDAVGSGAGHRFSKATADLVHGFHFLTGRPAFVLGIVR